MCAAFTRSTRSEGAPGAAPIRRRWPQPRLLLALGLAASVAGCRPGAELAPVDFSPRAGGAWRVSTPAEQGLDSALVAELYRQAGGVETLRSLLLVRNGALIAEHYFHGASLEEKARLQSVTKSVTSALAGIALERGCLGSLDRPMLDYFPEQAARVRDPRKRAITVRHLLQMRAGYPWEESTRELFEMLYRGFYPALLVDVPLKRDPGSGFEYSNLSSHLAGIVVARACSTDLRSYAREHLFGPLGVEMGEWIQDWNGYDNGHADLHLRPRDMAKFGQMYLDGGVWEGGRIVSAGWVRASLDTYSENAWTIGIGPNYREIGYGYCWWSARAGNRPFHFAWGHGGQQITLVPDQNMVIVVTSDPLWGEHGGGPWKKERENLNLVADFVAALP